MLCCGDTETLTNENGKIEPILDCTGKYFVLGALVKETGGKEVFYKKEDMWKRIIELGKKEFKRGKRLFMYFHNASYDFYNIADLKDPNIRWFCESPFIASYMIDVEKRFKSLKDLKGWQYYAKIENIRYKLKEENGEFIAYYKKEMIKFLDSMSIYRMSLKKMGDIIEHPKTEMPIEFEGKNITKSKLKEMATYCINDCIVTLKGVQKVKERLKEDGIYIRNLCTINQIAINYIINELKKRDCDYILKKGEKGITGYTYKTKYAEEIHQAYRASLTRVWDVGSFENVYYTDKNSLYPYSATKIRFPDLRTERKVKKPLEDYELKELLSKIGISKVMIKNNGCDIGLIPIRAIEKSYVPLKGKTIIGVYTNLELEEAIKSGYEIIDIEWSILYEETENPFIDIYNKLYEKRIKSGNEFDKWFYKSIMNSSLGKFGQRRINQELCIDSIENVEQYFERQGEVIRGIDGTTDVLYRLVLNDKPKPYYAPIIPCLVTAYARIYMYKQFKKVGKEKLLYTDTDSLITKGDHRELLNIGNKFNEWKVEKDIITNEDLCNTKAIIWGSKAKSVGNNITVSGAFKSDLTMEDFEKGMVTMKRTMGIKNNRDEEVGKIIIENKDLIKQKKNFIESEKLLSKELLYIDKNIEDVSYFLPYIEGITSNVFSSSL